MPKMVIIMPVVVIDDPGDGIPDSASAGQSAGPAVRTTPGSSSPSAWWGSWRPIALGVLEPANIAVLYEMNKPVPNGERIGRLDEEVHRDGGHHGHDADRHLDHHDSGGDPMSIDSAPVTVELGRSSLSTGGVVEHRSALL